MIHWDGKSSQEVEEGRSRKKLAQKVKGQGIQQMDRETQTRVAVVTIPINVSKDPVRTSSPRSKQTVCLNFHFKVCSYAEHKTKGLTYVCHVTDQGRT